MLYQYNQGLIFCRTIRIVVGVGFSTEGKARPSIHNNNKLIEMRYSASVRSCSKYVRLRDPIKLQQRTSVPHESCAVYMRCSMAYTLHPCFVTYAVPGPDPQRRICRRRCRIQPLVRSSLAQNPKILRCVAQLHPSLCPGITNFLRRVWGKSKLP